MDELPNHHRLTIRLDFETLPEGVTPGRYADQLTSELREALNDAGRGVQSTEAWVGPLYASVPADCPDCDSRLEIDRPHLDSENGAIAHARCPDEDCGWNGDAQYRLIDLLEDDASSLVAEGRLYPTTTEHR